MKKYLGLLAALAVGGSIVAAAQTLPGAAGVPGISVPMRGPIAQNDLIQVIPNGQPNAQSVYSYSGAIASADLYSYQVPLTGFSITPANGTGYLLLNPAGTLSTGTLTMQAAPSDGQRFSVFTSQTQTAITIAANTGQTLDAGVIGLAQPTALTAKTTYTWRYIGSLATWVRTS
jgi:hypothetical protein